MGGGRRCYREAVEGAEVDTIRLSMVGGVVEDDTVRLWGAAGNDQLGWGEQEVYI